MSVSMHRLPISSFATRKAMGQLRWDKMLYEKKDRDTHARSRVHTEDTCVA